MFFWDLGNVVFFKKKKKTSAPAALNEKVCVSILEFTEHKQFWPFRMKRIVQLPQPALLPVWPEDHTHDALFSKKTINRVFRLFRLVYFSESYGSSLANTDPWFRGYCYSPPPTFHHLSLVFLKVFWDVVWQPYSIHFSSKHYYKQSNWMGTLNIDSMHDRLQCQSVPSGFILGNLPALL